VAEYGLIRLVHGNRCRYLGLDFSFNHLEKVINAPNIIGRETGPVRRAMAGRDRHGEVMEAEFIHGDPDV
jgi:hypothetical protein